MNAAIPEYHLGRRKKISVWLESHRRNLRAGWWIYTRNRLAVFGLVLFILYAVMAIAHPILMETVWPKGVYDPFTGYDLDIFIHPSLPSPRHLLGTDTLGRDVFSILLAATTPTFQMAIVAALTTALVGTVVGAVSAYYRGRVDGFFTHLADLSLLVPAPLLMVVIGFVLDIKPVEFGLLYGVLTGLGGVAIVLRAHALTIVSRPFIEASKVAGGGAAHIIFRHLIPHMLPLAAVNMMLTVTGAVFADGFVAFLGLSRAKLNWGSMIYDAFTYQAISENLAWNVLIPSALAISLFAAAFYFVSRGLQDVVDPRLADRRGAPPLPGS